DRLQQGLNQQKVGAATELERQRVPERMRQSANQLRAAAESGTQDKNAANAAAAAQQEMARALDKLADSLSAGDQPRDNESARLTEQLARAQELRERIDNLSRELERLAGQPSANPTPGDSGQGNQQRGQSAEGDANGGRSQLQADYNRQLQETRRL